MLCLKLAELMLDSSFFHIFFQGMQMCNPGNICALEAVTTMLLGICVHLSYHGFKPPPQKANLLVLQFKMCPSVRIRFTLQVGW